MKEKLVLMCLILLGCGTVNNVVKPEPKLDSSYDAPKPMSIEETFGRTHKSPFGVLTMGKIKAKQRIAVGDTIVGYRLSSGEVYKIKRIGVKDSTAAHRLLESDSLFWGLLVNPSFPDGVEIKDEDDNERVFGFSKIANVGLNVVRNATVQEIVSFATEKAVDTSLEDRESARDFIRLNPRFKKAFIALTQMIIDELNILRSREGLADRTLTQAINKWLNEVDENN